MVAWAMVPLALRAERSDSARAKKVYRGFAGLAIVVVLVFFEVLLVPLARASVSDHGSFSRPYAGAVLYWRGTDSDMELLWQQLDRPGGPRGWDYSDLEWRNQFVAILRKRQPRQVGERLSQLLLRHPTGVLTAIALDLMEHERHYETAPILLRHALHVMGQPSQECTNALVRMGVPQASLAVLFRARIAASRSGLGEDFPLSSADRATLRKLVGEDAGVSSQAWGLYDQRIAAVPSPLPKAIQKEVDSTVSCFIAYYRARRILAQARSELFARRIDLDGTAGERELIDKWRKNRRKDRRLPADAIELNTAPQPRQAQRVIQDCWDQIYRDTRVEEPDFGVPTVEGLEKEIDAYIASVNAVVAKYAPPATTPAGTAPAASGPASRATTQRRE
jgi:hypothetical protein